MVMRVLFLSLKAQGCQNTGPWSSFGQRIKSDLFRCCLSQSRVAKIWIPGPAAGASITSKPGLPRFGGILGTLTRSFLRRTVQRAQMAQFCHTLCPQ